MIGRLRVFVKEYSSLWWIVLIALIAPSFFRFNYQDPNKRAVATVNGEPLELSEFKRLSQMMQSERQMFNQRYGLNLDVAVDPIAVVDRGVESIVLNDLVRAQGIVINPEVLSSLIRSSMCQMFGIKPNQFSVDFYNYYIKQTGMDVRDFESEQERALARSMVEELVGAAAYSPRFAREEEFLGKKSFALLSFVKDGYLKDAKSTPASNEELSLFYEENKNNYRLPDIKRVSYVVVDPSVYTKQITISDEQVESYYKHKKDSAYKAKDEYQIRRVLIAVPKDATPAEVERFKAKATDCLNKAKESQDAFADVAKTLSDDTKSSKKGGLSDWFTLGTFSYELEAELIKLKETGKTTSVVKSADGFEFAQLVAKKDGAYKSLDSVRKEIVKALTKRSAADMFRAEADQLLREAKDTADFVNALEDFAKDRKSKVEKTADLDQSMSQGESLENVLTQKAFGSFSEKPKKRGQFIHNEKNIIFVVTESQSGRFSSFEDVLSSIRDSFYEQKAAMLLKNDVATARKQYLIEKLSLADISKKYAHIKFYETSLIEKKDSIKGFDKDSGLNEKIFKLESPEMCATVPVLEGTVVLASLIEQQPSDKPAEKDSVDLKKTESVLLKGFIATLKRNAKIELSSEHFSASSHE
ncbi:hypothetical protein FJ366_02125 [Candidatus Dependentiae bacterium]|nr:hypothetical protein [Candidatus Dependentiae bacterium]